MSDLELQQLFDNTFDCYTYYEDDSMEEVKEPAMTKATFTAETFKLLRKQANDARTEKSKCAIPSVSQQRELLVAFCKQLEKAGGNKFVEVEWLVDNFLATNCG